MEYKLIYHGLTKSVDKSSEKMILDEYVGIVQEKEKYRNLAEKYGSYETMYREECHKLTGFKLALICIGIEIVEVDEE